MTTSVHKSTIRGALIRSGLLHYQKMHTPPLMTDNHRKRRLEWAMENIKFKEEEWRQVVFSDEKKFNLDGPDD